MEPLITHLDDEDGAVVRFGPVLYVVWRAPDTPAAIPHADAAVHAMTKRYGKGRNLLYVHRAPESTPFGRRDEASRGAVMEHFDRTEPYFRAAALAIEATGFQGAIVRSVVAGIMLVRRSQVRTKVFPDARQGVRWLRNVTDPSARFDPDTLIRELQTRELCRVVGVGDDYAVG